MYAVVVEDRSLHDRGETNMLRYSSFFAFVLAGLAKSSFGPQRHSLKTVITFAESAAIAAFIVPTLADLLLFR